MERGGAGQKHRHLETKRLVAELSQTWWASLVGFHAFIQSLVYSFLCEIFTDFLLWERGCTNILSGVGAKVNQIGTLS